LINNQYDYMDSRLEQGCCPKCNIKLQFVEVHGHYQCVACKCVINDCCNGEQAQKIYEPKRGSRIFDGFSSESNKNGTGWVVRSRNYKL